MWAFGIGTDRGIGTTVVAYGTGIIPSESDMIMVKWYSCISMFVFHIGALLFTRKTTLRKVSWYESGDADADRKFLFKIGCIISIIVVPIVFVSKLLEVRIALVHGYNALYYGDYATQSGYLQIILYLFFPALICLLIGSNFSKVITRFVFIIFALYSLLGMEWQHFF